MVSRREIVKGLGAASGAVPLAGCTGTPEWFELIDVGIIERENSLAAFVEAENITDAKRDLRVEIAAYSETGTRVSHWRNVRRLNVRPGKRVRGYYVFEAGDSGWADTNDLGQVVDTHTAKIKDDQFMDEDAVYGGEDIGTTFN